MNEAPEFSYHVNPRLADGQWVALPANPDQCAALAMRFGLVAINALSGRVQLSAKDGAVMAEGDFHAEIVQSCVVTAEDFTSSVAGPVNLRFEPESAAMPLDGEIELDADACDTVFYSGDFIDLGEALAETLALTLDPYPRGPNADAAAKELGLVTPEDVGPFAMLKALK